MLPLKIFDKMNRHGNDEEVYLALVIGQKKVKSGIWSLGSEDEKILAYGSFETWGGDSAEELIVAADSSIAKAVASLPEVSKIQPNKVILGLPQLWLEGDDVKKEKKEILQTLCRKLLLSPQGFLVTPEAVTFFLKKQEGELASAILVNLEETEIIVSLITRGKFLGSRIISRSDNLALDLEEGLLRFEIQGDFPPRIILIDGENLNRAAQILVSYPWINPGREGKTNFLQLPKVESAPENFEISAIVSSGSREIRPKGEREIAKPQELPSLQKPQDIQETQEPHELAAPEVIIKEDFGFVEGKDVLQGVETTLEENREEVPPESVQNNFSQEHLEEDDPKQTIFSPVKKVKILFKPKINLRFLRYVLMPFKFLGKGVLPFLLGIFLIAGLLGVTYWGVVKAEVNLFVQPSRIEEEADFSVSTGASTISLEEMVLPAVEVSVEVSDNKQAEVKGKKTVGDKAGGEIVIYNGTDKARIYGKGAVIKGPGGLKFVLVQETSVPSKTTDLNASPPIDKWGEKKVGVEAAEIGTQYNISANSSLVLESLPATGSGLLIKNPEAFSGGTSREIQAVSKEDKTGLQKDLFVLLEEKAKNEITSKVSSQGHLLPDSIELKNKTEKFNHEVGDEAGQLSLETKAFFRAYFFKDEDIRKMGDELISPLIPENYGKEPVKEEKDFALKDKKKNLYHAKFTRDFLPVVNEEEIGRQLRAKSFKKAKGIIEETKVVAGYEIVIKPKLLSRLGLLPFKTENIKVTVKGI